MRTVEGILPINQTMKVQRVHPDAQMPVYATAGAACFDIHSVEACVLGEGTSTKRIVRTGLKVAVPAGFVLLIFSRSGMGFDDNVRLANCVGVIDSDYRGELKVKLTSDDKRLKNYPKGTRIAQGMLVRRPMVEFEEVDALDETVRGEGGLGSTGIFSTLTTQNVVN